MASVTNSFSWQAGLSFIMAAEGDSGGGGGRKKMTYSELQAALSDGHRQTTVAALKAALAESPDSAKSVSPPQKVQRISAASSNEVNLDNVGAVKDVSSADDQQNPENFILAPAGSSDVVIMPNLVGLAGYDHLKDLTYDEFENDLISKPAVVAAPAMITTPLAVVAAPAMITTPLAVVAAPAPLAAAAAAAADDNTTTDQESYFAQSLSTILSQIGSDSVLLQNTFTGQGISTFVPKKVELFTLNISRVAEAAKKNAVVECRITTNFDPQGVFISKTLELRITARLKLSKDEKTKGTGAEDIISITDDRLGRLFRDQNFVRLSSEGFLWATDFCYVFRVADLPQYICRLASKSGATITMEIVESGDIASVISAFTSDVAMRGCILAMCKPSKGARNAKFALFHPRTGDGTKVPRILKMHADRVYTFTEIPNDGREITGDMINDSIGNIYVALYNKCSIVVIQHHVARGFVVLWGSTTGDTKIKNIGRIKGAEANPATSDLVTRIDIKNTTGTIDGIFPVCQNVNIDAVTARFLIRVKKNVQPPQPTAAAAADVAVASAAETSAANAAEGMVKEYVLEITPQRSTGSGTGFGQKILVSRSENFSVVNESFLLIKDAFDYMLKNP